MESPGEMHLSTVNQKSTIMKTQLSIFFLMIFSLLGFNVQERTITGMVTSSTDGSPIPGVNVVLKGSSTGTTTNAEGRYTITIPSSGGTLVFSFIGFVTKEVKVGSGSTINVKLTEEAAHLSELVVTGYAGRRDKKAMEAGAYQPSLSYDYQQPQWNTEEYDGINENIFHDALRNPLSTFFH
jgi:Ca-activated chloride channel homolog